MPSLKESQNNELCQPLWNEGQVAEYLSLSLKTVQMWRSRGRGPVYLKIGRNVRYRRADVPAFCAQSLVVPGRVR